MHPCGAGGLQGRRARGLRRAAILAGALATLLAPAPAARAAVTLGSDLATAPDFGGGPVGTVVTADLPGRPTTAPFDGVITRWRIRASGATWGTVRLRVVRQVTPPPTPTYQVVRSSASPPDTSFHGIHEFTSSLPIAAGEMIGLEATNQFQGVFSVPGAAAAFLSPSPADGVTVAPFATYEREVLFNADVEPDCDGDGLGDETQDSDLSGCAPAVPQRPGSRDLLELKAAKRRPLGKLAVRASCFEACNLTLKGTVRGAGKRLKLKRRTTRLEPGEIRRVGMRVQGSAKRRRLASLIAAGKRPKAKIVGIARAGDLVDRERVKVRVVAPKKR